MSKKLSPALQKLLKSRPKGCCVAAGPPKKTKREKRGDECRRKFYADELNAYWELLLCDDCYTEQKKNDRINMRESVLEERRLRK